MKHEAERTCIGCRGVFKKNDVVRLVAGPSGVAVDYREKLPGRGAYICLKEECIKKALSRGNLSRALRVEGPTLTVDVFVSLVSAAVKEKIRSLVLMAARAGKLSAGYSAVRDGIEKGRIRFVLYAVDLSDGSREKISPTAARAGIKEMELFSKDELGRMLGRELVGIIGVEDNGFAESLLKEAERLKNLINIQG